MSKGENKFLVNISLLINDIISFFCGNIILSITPHIRKKEFLILTTEREINPVIKIILIFTGPNKNTKFVLSV